MREYLRQQEMRSIETQRSLAINTALNNPKLGQIYLIFRGTDWLDISRSHLLQLEFTGACPVR